MINLREQNEILPVSDTKWSDRTKEITNRLFQLSEEFEKQKLVEDINESTKREDLIEKMADNVKNEFQREKRLQLQESLEIKKEIYNELITKSLVDIIYEAVVLDNEYKILYKDAINESTKEFLGVLLNEGYLSPENLHSNASVTASVLAEVCEIFTEEITSSRDKQAVNQLLEKFNNDSDKEIITKDVAKFVQNKVVKVIKNEKKIAEENKEKEEQIEKMVEEGFEPYRRPREEPSLFRALYINAARDISLQEGVNPLDNKKDLIFGDAIIMYTILETMNTLKILNIDASIAQEITSAITYHETKEK
jgi:hypothetical protein